jgi:hypothetical protein
MTEATRALVSASIRRTGARCCFANEVINITLHKGALIWLKGPRYFWVI